MLYTQFHMLKMMRMRRSNVNQLHVAVRKHFLIAAVSLRISVIIGKFPSLGKITRSNGITSDLRHLFQCPGYRSGNLAGTQNTNIHLITPLLNSKYP